MPRFVVHEIACKAAINPVKGMPFSWSLNPYRGCRHACVYCYARPTHEFLGLNSAEQFQEIIFAKSNAPDVVRRELSSRRWRGECVVVGTATDPYQQAESRYRLTRRILEVFRDCRNPVSITTKSPMILRDLDILSDLARVTDVNVCMTVTTMDERLWRKIEPTTAKPGRRLEAIRVLRSRGIRAGVLLSPVLPGLTDDNQHLEDVVSAASGANAVFVAWNVLRLGPGISEYYLPFIEQEFPSLVSRYKDLYRGHYAARHYVDVIKSRIESLLCKYDLLESRLIQSQARRTGFHQQQLDLFPAVA